VKKKTSCFNVKRNLRAYVSIALSSIEECVDKQYDCNTEVKTQWIWCAELAGFGYPRAPPKAIYCLACNTIRPHSRIIQDPPPPFSLSLSLSYFFQSSSLHITLDTHLISVSVVPINLTSNFYILCSKIIALSNFRSNFFTPLCFLFN
jgi:hypothetical protein